MRITADNRFKKIIIVGDRVLIKPSKPDERTASGLYLPPGVQEKEKVQQGYVIKTGPGRLRWFLIGLSLRFIELEKPLPNLPFAPEIGRR